MKKHLNFTLNITKSLSLQLDGVHVPRVSITSDKNVMSVNHNLVMSESGSSCRKRLGVGLLVRGRGRETRCHDHILN